MTLTQFSLSQSRTFLLMLRLFLTYADRFCHVFRYLFMANYISIIGDVYRFPKKYKNTTHPTFFLQYFAFHAYEIRAQSLYMYWLSIEIDSNTNTTINCPTCSHTQTHSNVCIYYVYIYIIYNMYVSDVSASAYRN